MKQKFKKLLIKHPNRIKLATVNTIVDEYSQQGYILTLRQLYYQLVSRDIIPNNVREYQKLSILLVHGRMAGIVDWSAIEDRVRRPRKISTFDSVPDLLEAAVSSYRRDKTEQQENHIELWVEKDALSGVFAKLVDKWNISISVNRGYSSASAMYDAYNRFKKAIDHKGAKAVRVLYLGDFDPSGEDMVRDIDERINEFWQGDADWDGYQGSGMFDFHIEKIALNTDQIEQYNPPPNPAKITDPRAKDFIAKHGVHSWEVDALQPNVLNTLVESAILKYIDIEQWKNVEKAEKKQKSNLANFISTFDSERTYKFDQQFYPIPELKWDIDKDDFIHEIAYICKIEDIVTYRYWKFYDEDINETFWCWSVAFDDSEKEVPTYREDYEGICKYSAQSHFDDTLKTLLRI